MKILITGSVDLLVFIFHPKSIKGLKVIGIDNLNNYYDVKLKKDRNNILKKNKNFIFKKVDIRNYNALEKIFIKYKIDTVVHLAAQAGVRYSLKNPKSYVDNNISGFFNILDISKNFKIKKFIYASTSSIYGIQKNIL